MADNRRVAYFYDAEVGNYHFGQGRYIPIAIAIVISSNEMDKLQVFL